MLHPCSRNGTRNGVPVLGFIFPSDPATCQVLAWFPGELSSLGSSFRARLIKSLQTCPGVALDVSDKDKRYACSVDIAVDWMKNHVMCKDTCLNFQWLLTTLLRVNFADALYHECTNSDIKYQHLLFIDSHLPLLSVFRMQTAQSDRAFSASYGASDARDPFVDDPRDPGRDSVLEMLYTQAKSQTFYDPSYYEFGCSVLGELMPMCSQTLCIDNFIEILSVIMQSNLVRNNRSKFPLSHLFSKINYNKCSGRAYYDIFYQHSQRSPLMCTFIRRMVYICVTGMHEYATVRPPFASRLALFSELIAPDDHTANMSFISVWWKRLYTLIHSAHTEFFVVSLMRYPSMHNIYRSDPSRVNTEATSLRLMETMRAQISRIPLIDHMFLDRLYNICGQSPERSIGTGVFYRHAFKAFIKNKLLSPVSSGNVAPEQRLVDSFFSSDLREMFSFLIVGKDERKYMDKHPGELPSYSASRDVLCPDRTIDKFPELCVIRDYLNTVCEGEVWRSTRIEWDDKFSEVAESLGRTYEEARKFNRDWVGKLKKIQFVWVLVGEMIKVWETLWKIVSTLTLEQRLLVLNIPDNWRENERRVDVFFERMPDQWKRRDTFPWTTLRDLGISSFTIKEMQTCEDVYHAPKPESRIFMSFVNIIQRVGMGEFLMMYRFIIRLDAQLQITQYSLPIEMEMAQMRALRIRYGMEESIDVPLPADAGQIHYCPSCQTIRTRVAGEKSFTNRGGHIGTPKLLIDMFTHDIYCKKKKKNRGAGENKPDPTMRKEDCTADEMAQYMAENLKRYTGVSCTDTKVQTYNMIGKIMLFGDKHYALCMRCGMLAIFDICLFQGGLFECGFCEDYLQRISAFSNRMYDMTAEKYIQQDKAYERISIDPQTYLFPKHWPTCFSPEAIVDSIEDLVELGLPDIAKQKLEMDCIDSHRSLLLADVENTVCTMCTDLRWTRSELTLAEWDMARYNQLEIDAARDTAVRVAPTSKKYFVYDDMDKDRVNRRVRCCYLCKTHRFDRFDAVFAGKKYVRLSEFVAHLRENVIENGSDGKWIKRKESDMAAEILTESVTHAKNNAITKQQKYRDDLKTKYPDTFIPNFGYARPKEYLNTYDPLKK